MKKLLILFPVFLLLFIAYEILLFIDNYAQPGRMRETPAVRPHERAVRFFETATVPWGGGEAFFRVTKGEELSSPLKGRPSEELKLGKKLYFIYCAQCHGRDHDGNGTVGQSFFPLPTDLRGHRVQGLPEGTIFKEISYGMESPRGRQPPLASTIGILDRWRIVAYLKSLGPRR